MCDARLVSRVSHVACVSFSTLSTISARCFPDSDSPVPSSMLYVISQLYCGNGNERRDKVYLVECERSEAHLEIYHICFY